MIAGKAHLFQDRRAEDLALFSPDLRGHKRIGRGVRNFKAIWDRAREGVLTGTFDEFSQNPTMKQHLLNSGTNILTEVSPSDPVWSIGLLADDPEASNPRRWPEIVLLGNALSTVRDVIRTSEPGLANLVSSRQLAI